MGFLGLSWFKDQKKKELEEYNQRLEEQLKDKQEELSYYQDLAEQNSSAAFNKTIEVEKLKQQLNNKIFLINSTLTVVLEDGTTLVKSNANNEDLELVKKATSREEIDSIMLSKEVVEQRQAIKEENDKVAKIVEGFELLEKSGYFEIKDSSVYFKGINRSLPELLVTKFTEILNNNKLSVNDVNLESLKNDLEFTSLVKFWKKCCLNPNSQSAEDLYGFLSKHQFKIDKHGNFYCYRRVQSKSDNRDLIEFISNTYTKIKAVWKKKASSFDVFRDGENNYSFTKVENSPNKIQNTDDILVGNLQELYDNLSSLKENEYTSAHTGKESYKIGTVISMPRNEGSDDNTVSCSFGFHAASKAYDYTGFGDTDILMIVNPMDVLAVPVGEIGKLRTCRWFFACVLSQDERHILDEKEFDVTDLGDKFEYEMLQDFEDKIKNGFTEEIKRHTYQLPTITSKEINTIVKDLSSIKDELKNRVVSI